MVGIQLSNADVNSQVGSITRQFNALFLQVQQMQTFMAANDLKVAPFTFVAGDEANLKSAISDLDTLRQVYQGLATQASLKDFRTFAKLAWGFGF